MIDHQGLDVLLKQYFAEPGDSITILCPFISCATIEALLQNTEDKKVNIVTSWRSDHLQSGVSHLELYPLAKKKNWTLYINNEIHLKLYTNGDGSCYMGSANMTKRALSDTGSSNIEGLNKIGAMSLEDKIMIQSIIARSTLVTDEVYRTYLEWYEGIEGAIIEFQSIPFDFNEETDFLISKLPVIWSPKRLWALVQELEKPDSSWGEFEAMVHDLALFQIKTNDTEKEFMSSLKGSFSDNPFVSKFTEQIDEEGIQFGRAKEWLQNNCTTVPTPYRRELTTIVQCLFNWYEELYPEKFELIQQNVSQILRLKMGLSNKVHCDLTGRRLDRSWYVSSPDFSPQKGVQYKSCPWCSQLDGTKLIFRVARTRKHGVPDNSDSEFGFTPQRRNRSNPEGIQTWCLSCRRTPKPAKLPEGGLDIEQIDRLFGENLKITSKGF
jgi:hypothetical protein